MSIFESGVRDVRMAGGAKWVSGVADTRRPVIGGAHVARPLDGSRGAFAEAFIAFCRLIFPVALLVTAAAAAVIYGNEPARWLGDLDVGARPFDSGRLVLPATLFIVQLTNRRYGAGYAFMQVLGALAVVFLGTMYVGDDLTLLRGAALPEPRLLAGFGAGLVVAQLFSVFVFDRLRGPKWWHAPLFGSLFGGAALALVAYPAAYLGTGASWLAPMLAYMGVMAAEAVVLLVPYWLLRPVIAPLSGFGGY